MRLAALLLLAVVSAACGTGGETPVATADANESSADGPWVGCSGHPPGFPAAALEGPVGAEDADTPQAEGLRELIDDPDGIGELPADGWRLLYEDDSRAAFAAEREGQMVVELRPEAGRWVFSSSSGCHRIMLIPPEGHEPASWWLDPTGGDQSRSAELRVLASGWGCASGQPTGDRLQPPAVEEDGARVVITFTARAADGFQNCPSHPPTPYVVELDEPLGTRELLDGSFWPPRKPEPKQ
jgi:hypothetical protein